MLILTFGVKLVLKKKTIEANLDDENRLNITIFKENNRLVKFALNYSAKIDNSWEPIYLVDNFHGFIHEQRLWITKKPIPLPEYEGLDLKIVFDTFFEKIKENCLKFRKYYEMRKNG